MTRSESNTFFEDAGPNERFLVCHIRCAVYRRRLVRR